MANNRIHTTFDLLSSNVYNQPSLQAIDLPFELIGYSGPVNSSTGITTKINKHQELKAGHRIIIKGFDNDATYKVETEVTNSVDNLNGTITFLVLDNFVFEITEIMFYVPNEVKVKHGTIMDGNIQLTSIKPEEEKYPLIFQHEITRETFFNDKRNKLERESEVDLFFLTTADFQKWDIDDHNKFAIKPMRELALKFIDELKTSNGIGEFEDYEILDHVRFGTYSTEKGHETRVFNDKLSGVQLKIKIPFLKTCGCNHAVMNIPATPCIPRIITRTLKNSLANLSDVDLTNPTNTQVLVYVDGVWVNQDKPSGGVVDWEDVTNKPTTFTPSAHTHPISEVVGLQGDLDSKQNISEKGQANGYVPLNSSSLIEQQYLPSYVDDVIEGYLSGGVFYEENTHITPITGSVGKIYVDLTIGQSSRQYRYTGSAYIQITNGLIASTDDVPEGSTNKYFTEARALAAAPAETVNTIGSLVNGAASATPNDTDLVMSVESSVVKKNTWAQIKSFLKSYNDTLYKSISTVSGTIIVTSGTSFTTPSNITTSTVFYIELIGGGAGGAGRSTTNLSGSGGGGGGYCFVKITGLSPSTTYTCSIGAGGAGGADATNGNDGGNTTLIIGATTYTATGGIKGLTAASSNGGAGGTGINGDVNINGQNGAATSSTGSVAVISSQGGNSPKGWGHGGNPTFNSPGANGTGFGGGGSSAKGVGANAVGGNGSNGIIFCKWFN